MSDGSGFANPAQWNVPYALRRDLEGENARLRDLIGKMARLIGEAADLLDQAQS